MERDRGAKAQVPVKAMGKAAVAAKAEEEVPVQDQAVTAFVQTVEKEWPIR